MTKDTARALRLGALQAVVFILGVAMVAVFFATVLTAAAAKAEDAAGALPVSQVGIDALETSASASASASTLASASPSAAPWSPASQADLIALIECRAHQAGVIAEMARHLAGDMRYTLAHATLARASAIHGEAGRILDAAMDRPTQKAVAAAYFPDGFDLAEAEAEARVERSVRCIRLYAMISAKMTPRQLSLR